MLHRRKQALADEERLARGVTWCHELFAITYHVLELANPDATHYELIALWNERMYRGKVPDSLLDKAMAETRRLGAAGLPPFDK